MIKMKDGSEAVKKRLDLIGIREREKKRKMSFGQPRKRKGRRGGGSIVGLFLRKRWRSEVREAS